jgi:hypothetical protein
MAFPGALFPREIPCNRMLVGGFRSRLGWVRIKLNDPHPSLREAQADEAWVARRALRAVVPMTGRFVFETGGTINDMPSPAGNLALVPRGTVVAVTGRTGNWYRVLLPDGQVGFALPALSLRLVPGLNCWEGYPTRP